ncbi:MAG: hypothetical protein QOF94_3135 [Acidobacteriaceae bacterium]|jgi:hypothetical protein
MTLNKRPLGLGGVAITVTGFGTWHSAVAVGLTVGERRMTTARLQACGVQ